MQEDIKKFKGNDVGDVVHLGNVDVLIYKHSITKRLVGEYIVTTTEITVQEISSGEKFNTIDRSRIPRKGSIHLK